MAKDVYKKGIGELQRLLAEHQRRITKMQARTKKLEAAVELICWEQQSNRNGRANPGTPSPRKKQTVK